MYKRMCMGGCGDETKNGQLEKYMNFIAVTGDEGTLNGPCSRRGCTPEWALVCGGMLTRIWFAG